MNVAEFRPVCAPGGKVCTPPCCPCVTSRWPVVFWRCIFAQTRWKQLDWLCLFCGQDGLDGLVWTSKRPEILIWWEGTVGQTRSHTHTTQHKLHTWMPSSPTSPYRWLRRPFFYIAMETLVLCSFREENSGDKLGELTSWLEEKPEHRWHSAATVSLEKLFLFCFITFHRGNAALAGDDCGI